MRSELRRALRRVNYALVLYAIVRRTIRTVAGIVLGYRTVRHLIRYVNRYERSTVGHPWEVILEYDLVKALFEIWFKLAGAELHARLSKKMLMEGQVQ